MVRRHNRRKDDHPDQKEHYSLREQVRYLKAKIRAEGGKAFYVYSVLRILVIVTAIRCFITGSYENFALCLLSLVLFLLPAFFEEKFKVDIPPVFEAIIYIFIFSAEILGEVNKYYTSIPGWDTLLHTLNGFLCAAIGFSLVDVLNRKSKRIQLSPIYLAVVAFCFSMTIGVCWEFVEFTMDQLFYLDMQKDFIVKTIGSVTLDPTHSQKPFVIRNIARTIIETADGKSYTVEGGYLDIGIIDTMKDLMVNFVGAITFSVIGYFYEAGRTRKTKAGSAVTAAGTAITEGLMVRSLSDEELEEEHRRIFEQEQQIEQGRAARRSMRKVRSGKESEKEESGEPEEDNAGQQSHRSEGTGAVR